MQIVPSHAHLPVPLPACRFGRGGENRPDPDSPGGDSVAFIGTREQQFNRVYQDKVRRVAVALGYNSFFSPASLAVTAGKKPLDTMMALKQVLGFETMAPYVDYFEEWGKPKSVNWKKLEKPIVDESMRSMVWEALLPERFSKKKTELQMKFDQFAMEIGLLFLDAHPTQAEVIREAMRMDTIVVAEVLNMHPDDVDLLDLRKTFVEKYGEDAVKEFEMFTEWDKQF